MYFESDSFRPFFTTFNIVCITDTESSRLSNAPRVLNSEMKEAQEHWHASLCDDKTIRI